jgi:hypothetical protein
MESFCSSIFNNISDCFSELRFADFGRKLEGIECFPFVFGLRSDVDNH